MKIHLIGIGGTGMGALAGLLVQAGHQVRGSDGPLYPPMSTLLARLQIPLFEGYRPENVDWEPDRVVVGNICRKDHVEAVAARRRGLRLTSFPALLSELFLSHRHPIVVAGTHGKTTTTALAAHVLFWAGQHPGFLVGGIPKNFGQSYAVGHPPYFVLEGDEYDTAFFDKRPKFVHYRPRTVILTGVEFDHADIYSDLEAVKKAFALLIAQVPSDGRIVVCADSPVALELCQQATCPVETYSVRQPGANPALTWQGEAVAQAQGCQTLQVRCRGESLGTFQVPLSGRHNLENALAVLAVCHGLGLPKESIAGGLASFSGVKRRQEVRGVESQVTVIDDFAHHPTAIAETLRGLAAAYPESRLVAVFEPRSATSRRNVFQQAFAQALAVAQHVVLPPLHDPSGIAAEQRLDLVQLVGDLNRAGTEAHHLPSVEAIVTHLAQIAQANDVVVVMSSGGFGGLVPLLLEQLKSDPPSERQSDLPSERQSDRGAPHE